MVLSIIRKLRTDLNMTQKQPADKLGVSDKAVSKWERGLGCPDMTLVTELSEILSVSLESLLSGSTETSDFKEVNMKKNKYYICPQCGNITVCTGDAEVSCCGRKLTAATPVKAAEEQKLSAEIVEDEWFISGSCPMTKDDYISFLFDKKPSGIICIPPSNGALKPFDGIIQTKKRLGYPNRFFVVSTKKTAQNLNGVWCERWDLNPHVKDTRTSNVPVCLFQHSRIFPDLFNQSAFIL